MKHPEAQRLDLTTSIPLIARRVPGSAVVAFKLYLAAGAADDPAGAEGMANLVSEMFLEGTENFDSATLAEMIEAEGVHLSGNAGKDHFTISMLGTPEGFTTCLPILAEVLSRPTFPEERLEIEKRLIVQDIHEEQDNPGEMAFQAFEERFFGEGHPYAHPVSGREASVSGISRDAVVAWQSGALHGAPGVAALVGEIDPRTVIAALGPALESWGQSAKPAVRPGVAAHPGLHRVPRALDAHWVVRGYRAASVHDEDYMPLRVVDGLLSSGSDGSLFAEVRDRFGLVYQIGSTYAARRGPSLFAVYYSTSVEHLPKVQEEVDGLLGALAERPLPGEQLERLKTYLKGMFVMSAETNMGQASQLGMYEILGMGYDFPDRFAEAVDAVTAEDMQRVVQTYFTDPTTVILGDA